MDENEIFKSHYFIMIKRLWMILWPYQNKRLKFYGRMINIYEDNQNEQILIENFVGLLYAQVYMFTALCTFVFEPQVVSPLNEPRPQMICYYAEYFVDQDEYLHSFVVMGTVITLNIVLAVDTSYIVITYHVLGLFNTLICRLEQLSEWADANVNRQDEVLHKFMIDTIKIHNKTLDLAELIRTTYDVCSFISFGKTLLILSIGSIDIMLNLKIPKVTMRIGFVIIGVILHLFFVNWPGHRFLDSSDDLAESIYSCRWYNVPPKTQFLMKFMMMRCLIPCQLTANPLFQMNFAFCESVLRKVLSFFIASCTYS